MRIINFFRQCVYYIFGHLIGFLCYKKRYLKGQYFKFGKLGWKWALCDGLRKIFLFKNIGIPWPVGPDVHVVGWRNIKFDNDDLHIFHTFGTYFQAINSKIIINKGCYIAPNVGIITTNHNFYDLNKHFDGKDIIIGDHSWIGMNSVILPGVELGPYTVVGAQSVVTKSFIDGHQIIAGNPAKKIKNI